MSDRLLILEPHPGRRSVLVDFAHGRGYQPTAVASYAEFVRAWHPGIRVIILSLPMARTDAIEAIRLLAGRESDAGVILTSDTDPRILSAAGRLVKARGLRLLGALPVPFGAAEFGALLLDPEPEPDPQTLVLAVQMVRDELRACMKNGLVRTWFQPKIDVRSLRCVAVEALVRLAHPHRGLLRPSAFLALAEESGLIGELTAAVAREAFAWCARWQSGGVDLQVAVNISPLLLSDLELPATLDGWARELEVAPHRITLEVTESWVLEDRIAALDNLTRLRLRGFQLSIDDFGTGYSNMTLLHEIPYSEMKLDQRFVRTAARDRDARAIVESSIELGHRLGMRVVAEGVERQEDWDLITELGCDEGQGYFLARPMQADQFHDWLLRWNTSRGHT